MRWQLLVVTICALAEATDSKDFVVNEVIEVDECCVRRHRYQTLSYGISQDAMQIDVGHCHKDCQPETVEHHGEGKSESLCRAASSEMRRVSTRGGVVEVEAVLSCRSVSRPRSCSRLPHSLLVNPGTPFETSLDVGTCVGHCHGGEGCRPLRNRTVAVAGPNGSQCYVIIEECHCAPSCYRAVHTETVYDYRTNSSSPTIREVDIGRCVGTCVGGAPYLCVMKDAKTGKCLAGLWGKTPSCVASRLHTHTYVDGDGDAQQLIEAVDCSCG